MNKIPLLFVLFLTSLQITAQPQQSYFITTWKTDNIGHSNDTSIIIPTNGDGYNYDVDWNNDGNWETGFTGNATHDYGIEGTYTVAIRGDFPQIYFNFQGDQQKIVSIDQWGSNPWQSMKNAFAGCKFLTYTASDTPDLSNVTTLELMFGFASIFNGDISNWDTSNVTDMNSMFGAAEAFNQNIGNWNVENVTDMSYMFYNAFSFDQNLGNWNVSNVSNMADMFTGVTLSTANYDALLNGWSNLPLQNNVVFKAGNSKYCNGQTARSNMTTNFGWNISDGGQNCQATYFITKWKTDNPGVSNATSITIPTFGNGYSYDVDWNSDGTFDDIGVTGNISHDYGTSGTYTVTIRGDFPRIYFNNSGDREKIISLEQWGNFTWSSMANAFYGCSNLVGNATDIPDLSMVSDMSNMFANATAFNVNIGNWDVSNVTTMSGMFTGAFLSRSNYDSLLNGWNTLPLKNGVQFDAGNSQYCYGQAARQNIIDNFGWVIADQGTFCPSPDYFITTWRTDNGTSPTSITIPATGAGYNFDVDWHNDGNWETGFTSSATHNYGTAGTYSIAIRGTFPGFKFNSKKIISVDQWGSNQWETMESMFRSCTNVVIHTTDAPNLSQVTDMSSMFQSAKMFDQDISHWDVSNVTNMYRMFNSADIFNQDISSWDVSNVTNMQRVFNLAKKFNQPLDSWNVANVTDLSFMFSGAKEFNQNLNSWDVSSVTDMNYMFMQAEAFDGDIGNWSVGNVTTMEGLFFQALAFNKDINNWDVSNVTSMESMFRKAEVFNQPLDLWNVGNVTNMRSIFNDAYMFDQYIGSWNVATVTDMSFMFQNARVFNQDIGSWNVSSVTNMFATFSDASMFNQNIGNWDVSNVITMNGMFNSASVFNQDISNWDVSSVTNMRYMFVSALAFNQDIGIWDVSNVLFMDGMFSNTPFNQDISSWNVSNVISMSNMFSYTTEFNQDIGIWDVSSVTDISWMFNDAEVFNQDIGNWNVGNVTKMGGVFSKAVLFNQDIGSWNTSNVTEMQGMFYGATNFNQYIGDWDVSKVSQMYSMFRAAPLFNQDIGGWNVGKVLQMQRMFEGATVFDQDIGSWNVSWVQNMEYMFKDASAFNQDIGSWNVGAVSVMNAMFSNAYTFNQDIGNWNVSNVDDTYSMFYNASSFNQDIGGWDVSNIYGMSSMFENAIAFDQNIGSWDVSNTFEMANMFRGAKLSVTNYDALLNGWSSQDLQNYPVYFHGGDSQYCNGEAARQNIINSHGWNITDGGRNCNNTCGDITEYTTAGGWSNGLPTDGKLVIIADNYNTTLGSIDACGIEINEGITLTVSEGTTIRAENNIVINGDLIFLSSASGNGEMASMGVNAAVNGQATVQRYISANRSYRMVSPAVSTTNSINANWQEGVNNNGTGYGDNQNPNPGFGTHITGSATGTNGFDATITGVASLYKVNVTNQEFIPVANTNVGKLTAGDGFLMFVRGDRSIDLNDNAPTPTETVLRASGQLMVGDRTQTFTSPASGAFVMFGNPYQSAVDVNAVFGSSTNVNTNQYYVYDPTLGDFGSYVTVDLINGTNTGGFANQYLQPGQGGQAATLSAGSVDINFQESHKTPGQVTATNATGMLGDGLLVGQLFTLENYNSGGPLHDSFVIHFSEVEDNALTPKDALKPMNFYENLGINHNETHLSIEKRQAPQIGDNIILFTDGYQHHTYVLKLEIEGLEHIAMFLVDNFTGTSSLIEPSANTYTFSVDAYNPLSMATDRFYISTEQRLGVNDSNLLTGIRLYPNPMDGNTFYMDAPQLNGHEVSVSISDLTGRSIYEQTVACQDNIIPVTLGDASASGVYMVTLKNGGESQTFRLLKK